MQFVLKLNTELIDICIQVPTNGLTLVFTNHMKEVLTERILSLVKWMVWMRIALHQYKIPSYCLLTHDSHSVTSPPLQLIVHARLHWLYYLYVLCHLVLWKRSFEVASLINIPCSCPNLDSSYSLIGIWL